MGGSRSFGAVPGGGGSSPDADASTKGVVQLAGDLGGTSSAPTVPGAAKKLTATGTKTGTYTAGLNELVPVNASGGGFTITLPAANVAGSVVAVRRQEFGGNSVTISRAGSDTIGGSPTLVLGTTGGVTLISDGAGVWTVQMESQSITALDGRYPIKSNNLSDVASASTARTNLSVPARADLALAAADYGVLYNGSDQTTNLQAALTAAGSSRGQVTITGPLTVTATLTVPDGVTLAGVGGLAKITVAAGFNYPVVNFDGVTGGVRDLTIQKAAGAAAGGNGVAVRVAGNSDGVLISGVTADGMYAGFYIAGQLGTTPGTAKRAAFIRCRALNSGGFGFELDECDGVELAHCVSNVSGLDGVKLRRKVKNARIIGGYFTGAVGGDGMDCYAGGDTFTIDGAAFVANTLNGLTIKNDDLSKSDPGTYGYVRSANVVGVIASGNGGSGLAIHRSSGNPDDPTEPLDTGINVVGAQCHGNTNYGLYLNARRVTVTALSATRNGLDGVFFEPACADVDLVGVHAAGNSATNSGTRDGIVLQGTRIRVIGGSSIGSDPDGATSDADLAAGTKTQRYGLRVAAAATIVDVYGFQALYNATGPLSDASNSVRWGGPAYGLPLVAGYYIVPGGGRSTLAMVQSVEYAVPVYISMPGTIVRLGIEVTVAGAASTVIRLGVRADLAHLPGVVLGETTVAGDAISTGVESTVAITAPYPGVYWFTATAQGGTPTVRSCNGSLGFASGAPSLITALGATPSGGYQTTATITGSLPGTYTVAARAGGLPIVAARA